ncbi:MAG: asparagine synthase C-terminal domain-containing protein [Phycisphaerae bacterium]|nr:asparagine synthase C-terminal domain-containing protein [Phycisphaerae bacterium]
MTKMDPEILVVRCGSAWPRTAVRYQHGGSVVLEGQTLTVFSPFPSVDLLYWAIDRDRLVISGDARMVHRPEMRLDPRGVLSLLLYGAVVPPLTTFVEKRTFLPGYTTHVDLRDFRMRASPSVEWPELLPEDDYLPVAAQIDALAHAIDAELEEACVADPILLFSGGVDSGVLASRLKRLGFSNTSLVHYSFGDNSPDTIAAHAINAGLKFEFDSVRGHENGVAEILDGAAFRYHQPFCDHSAIPTHYLVSHVLDRYGTSRPVLDGTGADGAFGLFAKSRAYARINRIPRAMKALASFAYVNAGLWRSTGRLERATRIAHRLYTMPKLSASIAQHSMLGFGLRVDPNDLAEVTGAMETWIDPVRPRDDSFARIPLADLGLVCAGVFAHKNFSHFADAQCSIRYPFLAERVVKFALRRAQRWPGSMAPKHALKLLLLQSAPREAVIRPKSGFSSPDFENFGGSAFLERLESAVGPDSPIADFVDRRVVRRVIDDLRARRRVPPTTYSFAWSIAMTASWIRNIVPAAQVVQQRALTQGRTEWGAAETAALTEQISAFSSHEHTRKTPPRPAEG